LKYYELTCTTYLKRDIAFRESFEKIARYINYSMAQIESLKRLHNQNRFKYYTFNSFSPIERDRVYKRGKNYTFTIRSLREDFIDNIQNTLRENINNPNFLVVIAEKKILKQFFISELYSITPVVVTMENGKFWTLKEGKDILQLYQQLHSNLERKYRAFYKDGLEANENFIRILEVKNQKPQTIQIVKNGKPFKFFGNKFKIIPREDETSQKLAFTALACGLGEKNSFGGGFCVAK